MANLISIKGRLTKAFEHKTAKNGSTYSVSTLAVSVPTEKPDVWATQWFSLVSFPKSEADINALDEYCQGDTVLCGGTLKFEASSNDPNKIYAKIVTDVTNLEFIQHSRTYTQQLEDRYRVPPTNPPLSNIMKPSIPTI